MHVMAKAVQVRLNDGEYERLRTASERAGVTVPVWLKQMGLVGSVEANGGRVAVGVALTEKQEATVELAREVGVSQSKKMAKVTPTPRRESPLPESERSPAMGGGPVLECRDCGKPSADPGRNHREHTIDCRRFRMGVPV